VSSFALEHRSLESFFGNITNPQRPRWRKLRQTHGATCAMPQSDLVIGAPCDWSLGDRQWRQRSIDGRRHHPVG
jgi:hypothetical protein